MTTADTATTTAAAPPTSVRMTGRQVAALVVLLASQFMMAADFSVLNVALPEVGTSLGFSTGRLQWITTTFALCAAGCTLVFGRVGDYVGRRGIFTAGMVVLTVSSLVGGLADSPTMLLVARTLQGLATAAVTPAALALLTTAFTEPGLRTRALGLNSVMMSSGFSVGAILGGVLTDVFSWRWAFFINIPVAIAAIIVVPIVVDESRAEQRSRTVSDTTGGDTARATSTVYNDFGEPKTVTDPEQHTTAFTYDAYGNKQGETDADGQVYAFTHNAHGNLLATTLTNYTGSSATSQTAAAKLTEQRTYDAGGLLHTITDAIGVTTTYAYYDNGLTKQITRTGSLGTASVDEQDSYDDAGNLAAKTTANGSLTTTYTIDAADRTTATTEDPNTLVRTTAYTFDDDSRVLTSTQTDAAGDPAQKLTYTYDAAGDVLSAAQYVSSSLTLTTKATYDDRGLKVTATDAQNKVFSYTNDEAGRPTITMSPAITTTEAGTGTTQTSYPTTINGYDTFGDRIAAEDANGHITATAYDRDGRRTGTTLPSYNGTSATTAWTYDASGDVLSETDPKGETDYAYDQLGDLVQQTNPAISISGTATRGTFTYSYDLAGDRLTETSPYGSVTHHSYDDLGRDSSSWAYVYTSTSAQTKQETDTTYNSAGQVARTGSVTGVAANYTYDALGRTLTASDTTGDTTTYSYDLRDDVIKTVLPDQSIQSATYDAAGRKTATANTTSAGTVLSSTSATYTDNGYLKTTIDARQHTTSYEYDDLGDLTKQTEPVTDTASIVTKYGYDAAGHQTAYTDGNGDTTYYTYNALGLPASKEVPAVTGYTSDADRTTVARVVSR